MKKKRWQKPKLIVLIKKDGVEGTLFVCKGGLSNQTGPVTSTTVCAVQQPGTICVTCSQYLYS